MLLPSAHIQQHAAVCGLEEAKEQKVEQREEKHQADDSQQHATRSKRKRQSQSPHKPPVADKRKQTAKDRAKTQRTAPPATEEKDSAAEEGDERKQSHHPRPLAFINTPPAASHTYSPSSRTLHAILPDATSSAQQQRKRPRVKRAVITTYPPSSPVLGYSSDGTPAGGGMGGGWQLKINIPSPSPPPLSLAVYAQFSSPTTTAPPSSAPSWLSYRTAAIPPSQPATAPKESASALTLLTYNVWFDDVHQRTRLTALSSLIDSLQPDIIALQEVTPPMLALLQRSTALRQYWLSPHPTAAPYFTLLLSRRQPVATYRIPFISQMGRDVTAMVVDVRGEEGGRREGEVRRLIVATSHLESLWQSKERRAQQLKQALGTLNSMASHPHTSPPTSTTTTSSSSSSSSSSTAASPASTSLFFMGDTNLRTTECSPLITAHHFTDLYPTLTHTHHTNDSAGYTYDTLVNRMASGGRKASRARYDRALARVGEGVEVVGMRRVGMEPIGEGVWISDHFGLVTEIKVS